LKIRGDIRKSRCTTSINDTGGTIASGSMTPAANLPSVSTTPTANYSTSFAGSVDTGSKFATGVNDTGGYLPPVSTMPVANLPLVQTTLVANNGNHYQTADNLN
jgi:hypothetical protein